MRKLDGSLEHPGNHPQTIHYIDTDTARKMPNCYRIVGSVALAVVLSAQSAYVIGSAIHGLIYRNGDAQTCENVEPLNIADSYQEAATTIKLYQLGPERTYAETLEIITPGDNGLEICSPRDIRVLNQLESNHGMNYYQEPPIEPKAPLDN